MTIKKLNYIYILCLAGCMLYFTNAYAQNNVTHFIKLNNVAVSSAIKPDVWISQKKSTNKFPIEVVMKFNKLPSETTRQLLQQSGITLSQYIPDLIYTAVVHKLPEHGVLGNADVLLVADMMPDWKMSAVLKSLDTDGEGSIDINILFSERGKYEDIIERLKDYEAILLQDRVASMGYAIVSVPLENVRALAGWQQISYVDIHLDDTPLNINSKASNRMQIAAANVSNDGYGLKGEGVAIGVGDNTSGVFHVDLSDRIINYNPERYTNHGVHINGITGGAGIADPHGEGMAPAAMLTNHFFSDVLDATPQISVKDNVVVTNNSYSASQGSCETAGSYNVLSAGLDNLCNDYNTVFQVFAAANDGEMNCPPFPDGFATIAAGYQPAKNNIVVASTDKEFVNAFNSSRGPLRDGRLKPEISAVGVDVNSTTQNDEYLVASGTSMACPQVAGGAALLTQRIRQLGGSFKPRADVLKTLLINGATDIGNEGPDFRFGFGFLNLERSLIMIDSNRYTTGSVDNAGLSSHSIVVPPNTARLKVTLCWFDRAASPLAEKQLVNDIDLEVIEPGSKLHLPLILDPTPANINKLAVEGYDRLNNTEQVVIHTPAAGTYNINIKGFRVPSGSQDYVIAYDFLPTGISVKYPITASKIKANDSTYIYWDAVADAGTFSLEFSTDSGGLWRTLDNNIPPSRRHYKWMVPDTINSGRCLIRLKRGSEQFVTGAFIINTQPDVRLNTTQCPGYINIDWSPIPNAALYNVMRKIGPAMIAVDTTSDTTYVFAGLALDSTYYVSVAPVINNLSGYRANAAKRTPNDGTCSGTISDGDIMIENIALPVSGRMFTSTQLTSGQILTMRIRNLDDAAHADYSVSYSINGGTWVTQNFTNGLPANSVRPVIVTGLDLSALDNYQIQVAVENVSVTDPVSLNDTSTIYVSQLPNDPVVLDYIDDFESTGEFTAIKDTAGLSDGRRWDFERTSDTGRLRSYVFSDVVISGQRSLSLDAYRVCKSNTNVVTGTFNLATYDANIDEVRMEFDYIIHGAPNANSGNIVSVTGSDTKPFKEIYAYEINRANYGKVLNSGSLSLSDAIVRQGDAFSTSTQLQFRQTNTTLIGGRTVGSGITIDNVKLYTVKNDVQLIDVIAPELLACGVTGPVPLSIRIRNGVPQDLSNVKVSYRLNSGTVVTENIPSIAAKKTVDYSFAKLLDITQSGAHLIDVWVVADGDTYNDNDSILQYKVRNQPLITSYPYVEDFEADPGFWYTNGINNTWAYGTPGAPKISEAASGQKAWVTNLFGNYNADELSFLYSPCFDLSSMEKPILTFKLALDIENCGIVFCDAAFMDYSLDGIKWERLGDYGDGINWYTDSNYLSWTVEDKTVWQHTEFNLPQFTGNVQFRFGIQTDPGSEKEGIGVDDIKIFERQFIVPENNIVSISPNPATNGVVNITWTSIAGTEMKLTIADMMGKEVYNTAVIAQEGMNKTTLNTPVISTGMYFMRISIGDKEFIRKIIFRRS